VLVVQVLSWGGSFSNMLNGGLIRQSMLAYLWTNIRMIMFHNISSMRVFWAVHLWPQGGPFRV
jgi:hypothetical protein